jgi:pyruvate-ferredoxin/flavodoxin oxidoreductase
VQNVTAMMMAGRGDELPVSALPVDGTYPSATTQWEKRNISRLCAGLGAECLHSVRQLQHGLPARRDPFQVLQRGQSGDCPQGFKTAPIDARGFPDIRYTLQVYLEDCTGCGLCVEVCPAKSKEQTGRKAINMAIKEPVLEE